MWLKTARSYDFADSNSQAIILFGSASTCFYKGNAGSDCALQRSRKVGSEGRVCGLSLVMQHYLFHSHREATLLNCQLINGGLGDVKACRDGVLKREYWFPGAPEETDRTDLLQRTHTLTPVPTSTAIESLTFSLLPSKGSFCALTGFL